MKLRKANNEDINLIVQMYNDGSESLKNDGVNQWQGIDRPGREELIEILDEVYVLDDNGAVSTARIMEYDNQYDNIYEGKWLNETKNYYSVHRVATLKSKKRQGYAKKMMDEIEKLALLNNIKSIKIDTYKDNIKMHNFLLNNGYTFCGIIILNNGAKRDAFEKILK